jgi:hypothetical protein
VAILPYLEQSAKFSQFVFEISTNLNASTVNAAAKLQTIPAYNCPSDSSTSEFNGNGKANYMQSAGGYGHGTPVAGHAQRGPFFYDSATKFRDMTDGTSNTALFGEIRRGPNLQGSPAVVASPNINDLSVATDVPAATFDASSPTNFINYITSQCDNRTLPAWQYRGLMYWRGEFHTTFYTHTITPNYKGRDCIRGNLGLNAGHFAARSWHTGGAHIVLGDGAVRFGSDNVDAGVWRAVGTMGAGEVVGEF